jgi:Subtilase family
VKKVVGLFLVVCSLAFLPAVNANEKKSIVIIDTAIDTAAKNLSGRIVHEVCIMETQRCPNKTNFMEGPGSASLPVSQIYSGGFEHGTIMSSVAAQVNPDLNIVFIRIVPMANNGRTGVYTDRSVTQALKWVAQNKTKFNIVAVSASFGRHNFKTLTNYCPVAQELQQTIAGLQGLGVASVFSAGNDYDYSRIDFPACIAESVAIGSTEKSTRISLYSNSGAELDFYSLGDYSTPVKRAVGTSPAAAGFAAYWAKVYQGNYQLTYDYIKSISKPTMNAKVKTNLFVDILG